MHRLTSNARTATVIAISTIAALAIFLSSKLIVDTTNEEIWKVQHEMNDREAARIARTLETQLSFGMTKSRVAESFQRSIENLDLNNGAIHVHDKSGNALCHPVEFYIGREVVSSNLVQEPVDLEAENFIPISKDANRSDVARTVAERESDVVSLQPVRGTDWVVAVRMNIPSPQRKTNPLAAKIILIDVLAALFFMLLMYTAVKRIDKQFMKATESKSQIAVDGVASLHGVTSEAKRESTSHTNLPYAQNGNEQIVASERKYTERVRQRFLIYWRDELISLSLQEVAFFYSHNNLTYVHCTNGNCHNTNVSLDEISKTLDPARFFRANRQFIISMSAIHKVHRYGNNQLKIIASPPSPIDLIISKHKATEFKEWLDN